MQIMESKYATRRLVKSDPDFQEMNRLQNMICYAYNPQLIWHDKETMDIEPLMMPTLIDTLKTAQGDLMDRGNFEVFRAAWAE